MLPTCTIQPQNLTDPYKQFVWDARTIDAPVVRFTDGNTDGDLDDTGDHTDHTLYYTSDANMNVTALVNTSGNVVERYLYDAYGRVTVLNGASDKDGAVNDWSADTDNTSDWDNQLLYCGYRHDPTIALYHVRHRVYDPDLGRWLQRDPLGYVDGMGLYEYCRSASLSYVDPSGEGMIEIETHWDEYNWSDDPLITATFRQPVDCDCDGNLTINGHPKTKQKRFDHDNAYKGWRAIYENTIVQNVQQSCSGRGGVELSLRFHLAKPSKKITGGTDGFKVGWTGSIRIGQNVGGNVHGKVSDDGATLGAGIDGGTSVESTGQLATSYTATYSWTVAYQLQGNTDDEYDALYCCRKSKTRKDGKGNALWEPFVAIRYSGHKFLNATRYDSATETSWSSKETVR